MAYNNYGAPPGAFGPPGGQNANGIPPPSFPPGMAAPGMPSQSPAGMQGQFVPPANMPDINFNAPVIRLGVDGGRSGGPGDRAERGGRDAGRGSNAEPLGSRSRAGLGADPGRDRNLERERQQVKENMLALQPPTKEETARTIFVGGLGDGVPDDAALESILRCAGKLRRWVRAKDANDKLCRFGFAEYEDVESLEAAAEIYQDLSLPLFRADGSLLKVKKEDEEQEDVQKAKLLVVVDNASREYIEQWKGRKKESDNDRQFRLDSCKELLDQTITGVINQASYIANGTNGEVNGDAEGDVVMGENGEANGDGAEVINVAIPLEDELSDIPENMRKMVAEEIKAFRDRSTKRDLERLKAEEEVEQEERRRSGAAPRVNRLASPLPSGSASNGVPLGPRGQQGVQGAPSGPKGFRGVQLPNDYVNGVAFVPGGGHNGQGTYVSLNQEDEDAEESDEELEHRREEKKNEELDKQYNEQMRRWHNRERTRGAAQEREREREEGERERAEKARESMLIRLAEWNDEEEAAKASHPYYRDRGRWAEKREHERKAEEREDDQDREAEERELAEEQQRQNEARGMANDFLGSLNMNAGEQGNTAKGGLKFSLGAAAAKTKQAQGAKRAMQDVEGLLEDEEDAANARAKRPELKPLQDTSTLPTDGQDLSDEDKAAARVQLAGEIPTGTEDLFAYPIKWQSLSNSLLDAEIRPFVEKKVVDYLGVQEDLLVDTVLDGVKARQNPAEIVEELTGPLEEEAEVLVKKVWRLLVFWSECESRGLSA